MLAKILQSTGVGNAWKSLVRVHGLLDPIPLVAYHRDENESDESINLQSEACSLFLPPPVVQDDEG